MSSLRRAFVVDGSYIMHRAHFAGHKNPYILDDGKDVTALQGFVWTINKILRHERPEFMAVAFDPPSSNVRKMIYPQYKANRTGKSVDLSEQFELAKQVLAAMNIAYFQPPNCEGDDIVATLVKILAVLQGVKIYIATADKDFYQLISENIFVYDMGPGRRNVVDSNGCLARLGVYPNQVIDYLSLVGDSVDNIPGAKGIGPKTAIKLLDEFGSLSKIYLALPEGGVYPPSVAEKLRKHAVDVFMSKQLVALNPNLKIITTYGRLAMKDPDRKKLAELYRYVGLKNLAEKL